MALYLGSHGNCKVMLNGIRYILNPSKIISTESEKIALLSSDNYLLQDINGIYLLPADHYTDNFLISLDNYILKDINDIYLTLNTQ